MKNSTSKNCLDLLTFLEGNWQLKRRITNKQSGEIFTGEGVALFCRSSKRRLNYSEQLELTASRRQAPITASQSYFYEAKGSNKLLKCFKDGRLFYELAIEGGQAKGEHLCRQDNYRALYSFAFDDIPPGFELIYYVTGPKKNLIIQTYYNLTPCLTKNSA